jgi:hypothetical protein
LHYSDSNGAQIGVHNSGVKLFQQCGQILRKTDREPSSARSANESNRAIKWILMLGVWSFSGLPSEVLS